MELENGASFSVETLLENAGFRAWVLNNDQEQSDSWNNYLEQHPEQREVIGQARQLLLDLQAEMAAHDLSEDTVEERLQAQLKQLGSPEKNLLQPSKLFHRDLFLPAGTLLFMTS